MSILYVVRDGFSYFIDNRYKTIINVVVVIRAVQLALTLMSGHTVCHSLSLTETLISVSCVVL